MPLIPPKSLFDPIADIDVNLAQIDRTHLSMQHLPQLQSGLIKATVLLLSDIQKIDIQ